MPGFLVLGDAALTPSGTAFVTATEAERIKQQIEVGLRLIRGTWIYDLNKGIPYREDVFGIRKDPNEVRAVFYDFLRGIRGVVNVDYVTLTFDTQTRTMAIDFRVRTRTGLVYTDQTQIGTI